MEDLLAQRSHGRKLGIACRGFGPGRGAGTIGTGGEDEESCGQEETHEFFLGKQRQLQLLMRIIIN